MMEKPLLESEEFLKAKERFEKLGPLGVTAEDHRALGSTPSELLEKNPGKTRAELMSDEEILAQFREWREEIEMYSGKEYEGNNFARNIAAKRKNDLGVSIEYLRDLGRLPEGFEG